MAAERFAKAEAEAAEVCYTNIQNRLYIPGM